MLEYAEAWYWTMEWDMVDNGPTLNRDQVTMDGLPEPNLSWFIKKKNSGFLFIRSRLLKESIWVWALPMREGITNITSHWQSPYSEWSLCSRNKPLKNTCTEQAQCYQVSLSMGLLDISRVKLDSYTSLFSQKIEKWGVAQWQLLGSLFWHPLILVMPLSFIWWIRGHFKNMYEL